MFFKIVAFVTCFLLTVTSMDLRDVTQRQDETRRQRDQKWSGLTQAAVQVFDRQFQTDLWPLAGGVTLLVGHPSTWRPMVSYERNILRRFPEMKVMYCQFPVTSLPAEVNTTLARIANIREVISVVVFSSNVTFFAGLFTLLASELVYKWTNFLHTAEWTVVTTIPIITFYEFKKIEVDFMTFITDADDNNIIVSQKSRVDPLHKVMTLTAVYGDNEDKVDILVTDLIDKPENKCEIRNNSNSIKCSIENWEGYLRESPLLYLQNRKSVLADMTLPVAILSEDEEKFLTRSVVGNQTVYDGYSVALLNTVANSLGFEYQFVSVDDGGYYGTVLDNGEATGITGQLARREAALSTMPFSRTESRRQKVDYILTPIALEEIVIIYRLPVAKEHLDLTYLDILQPEFWLYLIGPMLMVGVIGVVIHVLTSSCYSPGPRPFSKQDIRSLTTFPDHICFHTERKYKVQSGLILRTSWAIFWFILSSAYSAYLVTTFTVKTPELTIKTFKQLLDHPDYTFGMMQRDTSLLNALRTSKDPILHSVWSRMVERNKTDPRTFSVSYQYHTDRVLRGHYAFFIDTSIDVFPRELYPDVRTYPQKGFEELNNAYISTPQNTFYAEDLSKTLLSMEETGIIEKLQKVYFSREKVLHDKSKVSENQAVTFQRVELPVYFAAAGVVLGVLILIFEIAVYKFTHYVYDVN